MTRSPKRTQSRAPRPVPLPTMDGLPDDLPELLTASLARLGGRRLRQGLSPAMSYGRHNGPPRADARDAAVLALTYSRAGQWYLPLTQRQAHLTQHGGQISLPGGAVDEGELPSAAAVREAHEELGIVPAEVQLLGALPPVYVFNSNFLIHPWVAAARGPIEFYPNPAEVAEVIELPLKVLMAPDLFTRMTIRRGRLEFSAPAIHWQGKRIWGATCVILGELGRLLPN